MWSYAFIATDILQNQTSVYTLKTQCTVSLLMHMCSNSYRPKKNLKAEVLHNNF